MATMAPQLMIGSLKKAKKELTISGRGGTDFNPVLDYINQHVHYDGVIIFTDGCAPHPTPPRNKKTKILWLFESEYSYLYNQDNVSTIGKLTFLKEN